MTHLTVCNLERYQEKSRDYVLCFIRNPDKGSAFAKKTRLLQILPDWILWALLRRLRYDGLIFHQGQGIIGHVFYQRHGNRVCVFSVGVKEEFRGNRLATTFVETFIAEMHKDTSVSEVRIGKGGDAIVERICQKVISGTLPLPFPIEAGNEPGLIKFLRSPA